MIEKMLFGKGKRAFDRAEHKAGSCNPQLAKLLDAAQRDLTETIVADGTARANLTESLARICSFTR